MATDHSGGDDKENRNNTMNISVFCGASLPTMSIYDNVLSGFSLNGIVRCKNTKKVTPEMIFLYFFPTEKVTEHRSDTGRSLDLPYTQAEFE